MSAATSKNRPEGWPPTNSPADAASAVGGQPSGRSPNKPADSNSVCATCGAAFRCGMVSADATCWCFDMPHVMAVPLAGAAAENGDNASCLCPACLHQKLEETPHGNQS